jgi:hypothetical protein
MYWPGIPTKNKIPVMTFTPNPNAAQGNRRCREAKDTPFHHSENPQIHQNHHAQQKGQTNEMQGFASRPHPPGLRNERAHSTRQSAFRCGGSVASPDFRVANFAAGRTLGVLRSFSNRCRHHRGGIQECPASAVNEHRVACLLGRLIFDRAGVETRTAGSEHCSTCSRS